MAALNKIETLSGDPFLDLTRESLPGKGTGLFRLILAIDQHGVVCPGAAQAGTFAAVPTYSNVPGSISTFVPFPTRQTLRASAWPCPPLPEPSGPASISNCWFEFSSAIR